MNISPVLKIFAGWFFGGLILGGGFLYAYNPLAGLTGLTLIGMGLAMLVIPLVHILIMKYIESQDKERSNPGVTVAILIGILVLVIFALGSSGGFNFT